MINPLFFNSGGLLSAAQSYPSLSNTSSNTTLTSSQSITNSVSAANSTGANNLANTSQSQALNHNQGLTMSLTSTTSSESEPDFLENCQSTTLLADLEDEEELPEPEDENEDDENEDDDDYESEMMDEDCYEMRNGKRKNWDDEYVLKRQFSDLIPAFDPRPGRTNVNQTTDLEITLPTTEESIIKVIVFTFEIKFNDSICCSDGESLPTPSTFLNSARTKPVEYRRT